MFIPLPVVPNTTIINKTIIYSDTILPLKDSENNLKITSISDISESSLENCLKIIFESNPDVIFNTIQYSKSNKKVYFYTNQNISTNAYDESKFTSYKPITSKTGILEEVKNVFLSSKNKDSNCISLYDVLILLKRLNSGYDNLERKYRKELYYMAENKIVNNSLVYFHKFDFETKTIHISFVTRSDYDDIYFAKKSGDLYVLKSKSYYTVEDFSALCSTLSKMYDELLKYADYKNNKYTKNNIKTINSNFNVNIGHHGICLSVKDFNNEYRNELELFAPSYNDGYKLKCNSSVIKEAFNGKETEIFKRIFIKIKDCPEWSQAMLYEIRQNQLLEEQKIEEELTNKEIKKQKRLELKRKIFPFLK